jgi:nucleotide-binding universal stress UspA family protein
MDTSIVCGVDGSPGADAALAVAARLAERLERRLVLVHVAEPVLTPYAHAAPFGGMSPAGALAVEEQTAAQREAGMHVLERAAEAAGIEEAEQRVAIGAAAERLADIAAEEEAELIVVGSRGRGALRAAFLGSVSSTLAGIARCPVLIVPPGFERRLHRDGP